MSTVQILFPSSTPSPDPGPDRGSRAPRILEIGVVAAFGLSWAVLNSLLGSGLSAAPPVGVCLLLLIQLGIRRKPLRAALNLGTGSFARRRLVRVLTAAVLVAVPVTMVVVAVSAGRYIDDSWTALLMATILAVVYLVSRRPLFTVLVAGIVVTVTSWVLVPHLAAAPNGDPVVLARLDQQAHMGMLAGYHDLAVAQVDLGATQPVRVAGLGADAITPMEVGSLTKAMTGLVIADAVHRGELRLDVPVSTYLPQLAGSQAGTVTIGELVTHTAGYVDFGAPTLHRAAWQAPLGRSFLTADLTQMTQEVRTGDLTTRGTFVYSSLGATTAGQAVAAAAGMSYSDLMRTRLFEPLAMTHTAIEGDHALVAGSESQTGLPVQPWVMDAYAPAGAAVSTTADLAKLATALLDGTAPGMAALDPTTAMSTGETNRRIGGFWFTSTWQSGQTITWHNGQTGGYSSYLGLDRAHRRAVIVLSDVANPATTDIGTTLLAQHT